MPEQNKIIPQSLAELFITPIENYQHLVTRIIAYLSPKDLINLATITKEFSSHDFTPQLLKIAVNHNVSNSWKKHREPGQSYKQYYKDISQLETQVKSALGALPGDVLRQILSYLTDRELTRIAQASSFFNHFDRVNDKQLWEQRLPQQPGETQLAARWKHKLAVGKTYKKIYSESVPILQRRLLKEFFRQYPDIKLDKHGEMPDFMEETKQNLVKKMLRAVKTMQKQYTNQQKLIEACLKSNENEITPLIETIAEQTDANILSICIITAMYNEDKAVFYMIVDGLYEHGNLWYMVDRLVKSLSIQRNKERPWKNEDACVVIAKILLYRPDYLNSANAPTIKGSVPFIFMLVYNMPIEPLLIKLNIACVPGCVVESFSDPEDGSKNFILHYIINQFAHFDRKKLSAIFKLFKEVYTVSDDFLLELVGPGGTVLECLLCNNLQQEADNFMQSFGADTIFNYRTNDGKNLLYFSFDQAFYHSFEYYLEKYPKLIKIRYERDKTILHLIAEKVECYLEHTLENMEASLTAFDLENIKFIIASDKRIVNVQDVDGNTALHIALFNFNKALARILLKHGAKMNLKNNNRETVLQPMFKRLVAMKTSEITIAHIKTIYEILLFTFTNNVDILNKDDTGKTIMDYLDAKYLEIAGKITEDDLLHDKLMVARLESIRNMIEHFGNGTLFSEAYKNEQAQCKRLQQDIQELHLQKVELASQLSASEAFAKTQRSIIPTESSAANTSIQRLEKIVDVLKTEIEELDHQLKAQTDEQSPAPIADNNILQPRPSMG